MRFTAALLLAAAGLLAEDAREALDRGVQAFNSRQYSEAVELLQKAVDLDPSSAEAHMWLGTAQEQRYLISPASPPGRGILAGRGERIPARAADPSQR